MDHRGYEPVDTFRKTWLAIGLTWTAGFVDIVGYTVLDHILNANMSGNTVEIAFHSLHQNPERAMARAWAVLLFLAGLFVCAFIHEACNRHRIASSAAITLGLEAVLLAIFAVGVSRFNPALEIRMQSYRTFYLLLALSCAAMGLQNATLTRVGALNVRTTHVTGTLAKFAESGSRYIFWLHDKIRGPGKYRLREAIRLSPHHEDFRDTLITACLWVGFLAGGFCGAWLYRSWRSFALLLPVGLLVAFSLADIIWPMTARKAAVPER